MPRVEGKLVPRAKGGDELGRRAGTRVEARAASSNGAVRSREALTSLFSPRGEREERGG